MRESRWGRDECVHVQTCATSTFICQYWAREELGEYHGGPFTPLLQETEEKHGNVSLTVETSM